MSDATGLVQIPFSHFVKLLIAISECRPKPKTTSKKQTSRNTPLGQTEHWINGIKKYNVLEHSWGVFFRLLFPEEDVRRRYGMQEKTLLQSLVKCLGLREKEFRDWDKKFSCLGAAVQAAMPPTQEESPITIHTIDELLDELACTSPFSDSTVLMKHSNHRTRHEILKSLFRPLSPRAAGFLVQIILHDLRPLIYPLPPDATHLTTALKKYNSKSIQHLTKESVMRLVDSSGNLARLYAMECNLGEAADAYHSGRQYTYKIGHCIEIPISVKGRSCEHALRHFSQDPVVYAETKYDGERAQIHISISKGHPTIKIFSKSHRDSTLDRIGIHDTAFEAIGLSCGANPHKIENVVLDAEMVAFNDDKIDEFWRIEGLIALTAVGPRAGKPSKRDFSIDDASQITYASPSRHLGLVFFDILVHNSQDLRSHPYLARRKLLERLITTTPGLVLLAEQFPIYMRPSPNNPTMMKPTEQLKNIFSTAVANFQEGIILKGSQSKYRDFRFPWVKLKRDYIPGHGDCLDMVLLGAGYDRDRAAELGVPPGSFTTLYFGAVKNKNILDKAPTADPDFYIYVTSSYGLSRDHLEHINYLLKTSEHYVLPFEHSTKVSLPYTYRFQQGLEPPRILLRQPLVAEVFGAGFTKEQHSQVYSLRFPRVTKVHRFAEREWKDCPTVQEIHEIGRAESGKDRPDKDIDDTVDKIWGGNDVVSSPGVRSTPKRKRRLENTKSMLDEIDPPTPLTLKARRSAALRQQFKNAEGQVEEGRARKKAKLLKDADRREISTETLKATQKSQSARSSDQCGSHLASQMVPLISSNIDIPLLPQGMPETASHRRSPLTRGRPIRTTVVPKQALPYPPSPLQQISQPSFSSSQLAATSAISSLVLSQVHCSEQLSSAASSDMHVPSSETLVIRATFPQPGPACLYLWRQLSPEMQKILYRSVVWFARPSTNEDGQTSFHERPRKVEDPVYLASFGEFLGALDPQPCVLLQGVCRGIIFVDMDDEISQQLFDEAVEMLEPQFQKTGQRQGKPIWVFNLKSLSPETKQPKEIILL